MSTAKLGAALLVILVLVLGATTLARAETMDCTAITALPAVISDQGVHCLTSDLNTNAAVGNAIDIQTNNVVVDLNGFKLSGSAGLGTQAIGIHALNRQNITLKNGLISGFLVGIFLEDDAGLSQGHVVENVRAAQNTFVGMHVEGTGILVRDNQVAATGGTTTLGADADAIGILASGAGPRVVDNDVVDTTKQGAGMAVGIQFAAGTGGCTTGTSAPQCDIGAGILVDAGTVGGVAVDNRITGADKGIEFLPGATGKCRGNLTFGVPTPFTGCTNPDNGKLTQTITFTSTAPADATVGGPTYDVTATGGASGNPVIFTIDASATSVCSVLGSTVSFTAFGTCVIDANQAGDATYDPAPQVQQPFAVGKGSQTINFTSPVPANATVGGPTYNVMATGGASGNPVTFTIDASAMSVCSVSSSTVSFDSVGTCVINANQAGDANYNAALPAQQSFAVGKGAQTINFTSPVPANATVGGPTYNVMATGGASGNPVTFTINASAMSVCTIASGSTVSFIGVGTCVIDANQAGNTDYDPAPPAQQSFAVACPTITVSGTIPDLTLNQAMATATFTQTGGNGTITWSATGLPNGVGINASSGDVTGTPTASGSFNVTIKATGVGGCFGTKDLTVLVKAPPGINSATSYTKQIGTALSFSVTTTGPPTGGFPAATVSQAPVGGQTGFPAGVTFTPSPGSAAIGGSVTSGGAQTYTTTITANNGVNPNATQAFSLIITCPVITVTRIGGGSFPAGTFNVAYTGQSVTGSGGTGPYTFVVATGALPTNLSLASGGGISGTPSATGTFPFTVTATDNTGCTGTSAQFTIAINPVAGSDTYNNLVNNTEAVVPGGMTTSPSTPFVSLTGFVTDNDTPAGVTITSSNPIATTQGGSVTIAADGSFKYTPPVTVSALASDTFTYTISSNTGGTATPTTANGTVTLNLSGRVWYVNPNAGVNGNGQSQSPWNSTANIKQQGTPGGANTGDIIFVYNGPVGNLTANIPLLANQTLHGEGVALVVNSVTLRSAGTAPSLTASAANVVSLNNGNTIKGVTLSNTTNSLITGSPVGITVQNAMLTPSGTAQGINLSGGSGTVALTDVILTPSGTASGINLSGRSGTVAVTNVTLNGTNSGDMVSVNTGTETWTFTNSPITQTSGRALNVTNKTGGGMTFDAASTVTVSAGTANGAIVLSNNTGSGNIFTFNGKVALTVSGTARGLVGSSNGGVVNIVDNTSTITASGGAAIDFQNTTIGASGLNFRSVSANGGTNGIVLSATGSSGGLTVTGNAGTCDTLADTCTGGTIQNTSGHGILLTTTQSPSFSFMKITNIALSGIRGTDVTNFTLANSVIDGVNTSHTATDANVAFNTNGGGATENNLDGAVSITNNTLNNSYQHGVDILNYAGTISNLTITGNSFTSSTNASLSFGSAVNVYANKNNAGANFASITTGSISGNTMLNFPVGAGIQVLVGNTGAGPVGGTIGSLASPLLIQDNTITGNGPGLNGLGTNGIAVTVGHQSDGIFTIGQSGHPNTITNVRGNGIACSKFGNDSGSGANASKCIIAFNVINANNTANSAGINTGADSATANTNTPLLYLDIHNNNVSNTTGNGILSTIRSTDGTGTFHIENNTVVKPTGTSVYGIRVDSGNGTESAGATVCLKINGNTTEGSTNMSGSIKFPGIGIRQNNGSGPVAVFRIEGLSPTPANDGQMESYVSGQNPASVAGTFGTGGTASIDTGATFTAATCTIP